MEDELSDIPGFVVAEEPFTAEDIPHVENIGRKPNESHGIHGVPVTPEIAAQIRSAEAKAGHDTGKGPAAAREQSAAVFNCMRMLWLRWAQGHRH